jgi:hypothetical protein
MNTLSTLAIGIAPTHLPAFIAGLLAAIWLPFLRGQPASAVDRWASVLLGVSAAVHLLLPVGHPSGLLLSTALLVDGLAFAALAYLARAGRSWRLGTALLVTVTLLGYLITVGRGGEEADQVGIATALVELTAFGLAVVPARQPDRPRRFRRFAGSAVTLTAIVLVGAVIWVATFQAHQAGTAAAAGAAPSIGHSGEHGHEHLARAQAGVIMRPLPGGHHATVEQTAAAIALAGDVQRAAQRFARVTDALAAGYQLPLGVADLSEADGLDVHLEHPGYKKDGRLVDPERPEMLVYAMSNGRASLLGVVYVMEVAGRAGPAPGGPITRWHAHNLCLSLGPPGIGIVTPYGGCPPLSLTFTVPEMMHVWTVDPPGGPYAEAVPEEWARRHLAEHGIAW